MKRSKIMQKFTELVNEVVGGELYSYYPLGQYIVSAVGVCGGRPTFKYTRIEVIGILDLLAAGDTVEQLVTGYRGRLSREAIEEAQRLQMPDIYTTPFNLEYAR
jgi:uncharacterized protein (DUF433 family)